MTRRSNVLHLGEEMQTKGGEITFLRFKNRSRECLQEPVDVKLCGWPVFIPDGFFPRYPKPVIVA